jgi:hypothetical protein
LNSLIFESLILIKIQKQFSIFFLFSPNWTKSPGRSAQLSPARPLFVSDLAFDVATAEPDSGRRCIKYPCHPSSQGTDAPLSPVHFSLIK